MNLIGIYILILKESLKNYFKIEHNLKKLIILKNLIR